MDLRQLRYFVAVAERGGFGAAASALNVAQSALSRHIQQLEHELGGALLERGARGVSVTESGKVLLARGRWLLTTVDDIKAEVRTENREPSGTVRLGAPSSLATGCGHYPPVSWRWGRPRPRADLPSSSVARASLWRSATSPTIRRCRAIKNASPFSRPSSQVRSRLWSGRPLDFAMRPAIA